MQVPLLSGAHDALVAEIVDCAGGGPGLRGLAARRGRAALIGRGGPLLRTPLAATGGSQLLRAHNFVLCYCDRYC
jgi:hypothetical protein